MVMIWRSGPFTLGDRAPAALGLVKALILTASWEGHQAYRAILERFLDRLRASSLTNSLALMFRTFVTWKGG